MLGSYMCDTCPAILQDLRTLLGCRYMTLLTTSIVGRGDWLWNSENFKGLNNSAVSDVEQTRHVTLTAHKFIQDGLFLWGDDFGAILDGLEDTEEVEEQCAVIVRIVS